MNRSDKRRRKKLARKAADGARFVQEKAGRAIDPDRIRRAIGLAVQHHASGDFSRAETICRELLHIEPNQPVALHLLGVIYHQLGKNELAADLIGKALVHKPDYAEAHNNLGTIFRVMGRLDDAVTRYREAIAINPGFADAYFNLGVTYRDLNQPDDAVASYRDALSARPGFVEAHNNLGNTLLEMGRPGEAAESYARALTIEHDSAATHNNLGVALKEMNRLEEAAASYRKALAIKPDYAEAFNNLGTALRYQGRGDEAFECHRRAVSLDPRNNVYWVGLAQSLENLAFTSADDSLCQDLVRLLERPTTRPSVLARPVLSAIEHHPDFGPFTELMETGTPPVIVAYWDVAAQLSAIPLLLLIMSLAPLNNLRIERMLTVLRHAMLLQTVAGNTDEKGLPFTMALALQCFTNEYIFPETDEERAAVDCVQQQIASILDLDCDVPPFFIAALGAYRPLHRFPWAEKLCNRAWRGAVKDVIERQISEPFLERTLRSQISRLTPIQQSISRSVRAQYEENPFPRWIRTDTSGKGRTVEAVLCGPPLYLDLGDYVSPDRPEILVAGCGTGQQALGTASRYLNAQVFAIDLSVSSLAYAMRKTRELGFPNIEYAQADIMELGSLGRSFDIIECIGVLHHLEDPVAGWRVLAGLLRPGGLMLIGLYSELARRDIVHGRVLIAEKGYMTSAEDIRRSRQDIIALAEDGNSDMAMLCGTRDFFNMSNCRDMLFHVQEHRFTLPQIADALRDLGLKFVGFDMRDQGTLRKFRACFPTAEDFTSLSRWHEFECDHPYTFRGMYQFWCRKS